MQNELDMQLTMRPTLREGPGRAVAVPRTAERLDTNRRAPVATKKTTMTIPMTVEIKPATTFDVTLRSRPMKLKKETGRAVAVPAKECRKGTVNPESRRNYLRALRAAEMAAWEAADRSASEATVTSQPRLSEFSSELLRRDRWETVIYVVVVSAALVGLLANIGAFSRFASGWSQFAGLFERILS